MTNKKKTFFYFTVNRVIPLLCWELVRWFKCVVRQDIFIKSPNLWFSHHSHTNSYRTSRLKKLDLNFILTIYYLYSRIYLLSPHLCAICKKHAWQKNEWKHCYKTQLKFLSLYFYFYSLFLLFCRISFLSWKAIECQQEVILWTFFYLHSNYGKLLLNLYAIHSETVTGF